MSGRGQPSEERCTAVSDDGDGFCQATAIRGSGRCVFHHPKLRKPGPEEKVEYRTNYDLQGEVADLRSRLAAAEAELAEMDDGEWVTKPLSRWTEMVDALAERHRLRAGIQALADRYADRGAEGLCAHCVTGRLRSLLGNAD